MLIYFCLVFFFVWGCLYFRRRVDDWLVIFFFCFCVGLSYNEVWRSGGCEVEKIGGGGVIDFYSIKFF